MLFLQKMNNEAMLKSILKAIETNSKFVVTFQTLQLFVRNTMYQDASSIVKFEFPPGKICKVVCHSSIYKRVCQISEESWTLLGETAFIKEIFVEMDKILNQHGEFSVEYSIPVTKNPSKFDETRSGVAHFQACAWIYELKMRPLK